MHDYIINGEVYIKKNPSVVEKYCPNYSSLIQELLSKTFNTNDSNSLNNLPPEIILLLEETGLVTKTTTKIYDNSGFYQIYSNGNDFYLISKNNRTIKQYQTLSEINQEFVSLKDFLAKSLYVNRKYLPKNPELPEYIILLAWYDTYLLKDINTGKFTVLSQNDPINQEYTIGELIPNYDYTKEELLTIISRQELSGNLETEAPKR